MALGNQGTSPRLQRLIAFGAISLLAAATAAGFGRVFVGGAPQLKILAAGLASTAVASLLERRNLLLATLVSAALMVAAVGLLVFPSTTWHWLPTTDTIRAMAEAAKNVGYQARIETAPTQPLQPLLLAAVTAAWAAIFSAHALSVRAGSPLLALLPPVALVAFADTVLESSFRPGFGLLFLIGALAVVFVDGVRRVQRWGPVWTWQRQRRWFPGGATRGARRVAVIAVAFAGIAPAFLPGFGSTAIIDFGKSGSADRIRIDPQVSIISQLKDASPVTVFTVASDHPSYWRMLALDQFDSTSWHMSSDPRTTVGPGASLGTTPPGAPATSITQRFSLATDLVVQGMPAAYPPTQVDAPNLNLTYDPLLESVLLPGEQTLQKGSSYGVTSQVIEPTIQQLNAETFGTPGQYGRWVQLPTNLPNGIEDLAVQWTESKPTVFQKVLAIQDHLRDPGEYTYDDRVPARDDQFTLLDFLNNTRRGFCQQFASAMAVMLRTLGIPARVAVGFTTGTPTGEPVNGIQTYTVTTHEAHSWVEVLFPHYGWLAFEPTPRRTNPVAVNYYDPAIVDCVFSGGTNCLRSHLGSTGTTTTTTGPVKGLSAGELQLRHWISPFGNGRGGSKFGGREGGAGATPVIPRQRGRPYRLLLLALAAAGALALLLVPPSRAVRRRARLRRSAASPRRLILATYEVFTDRAGDLGLGRGPGETLEEYRARLAASGLLLNGDVDRLTAIAARAAYAPREPAREDARVVTEAARTVIRDLRKRTPLARRLAGIYRLER